MTTRVEKDGWAVLPGRFVDDRTGVDGSLCFGVATQSLETLQSQSHEFLSPSEIQRVQAFTAQRRTLSFLRGRFAAKSALRELAGGKRSDWHIEAGVFGQPIVHAPVRSVDPLLLSIAHTEHGAVAVAVPQSCPIALDVETLAPDNHRAISSQMTDMEIAWAKTQKQLPSVAALTLLWSAKEALSKLLSAGLAVDFKALALKDQMLDSLLGHLTARFEHFAHVRVEAVHDGLQALALVCPLTTRIDPPQIVSQMCAALRQAQSETSP